PRRIVRVPRGERAVRIGGIPEKAERHAQVGRVNEEVIALGSELGGALVECNRRREILARLLRLRGPRIEIDAFYSSATATAQETLQRGVGTRALAARRRKLDEPSLAGRAILDAPRTLVEIGESACGVTGCDPKLRERSMRLTSIAILL